MEVSLYKIIFISTNTLLKLGAQRPPGREGGIFVNIPEKNQYLLFSGVSLKRYSDVFIFDMNTKKWTKANCTGAQPKDLCYAYGWYDRPNFFFYGGKNKELSLSDVYFLDTNKWVWKKVITIDQPLPRFYHAGAKVKDRSVYIYGGIHVGRTSKLLSDLHIYDYSN